MLLKFLKVAENSFEKILLKKLRELDSNRLYDYTHHIDTKFDNPLKSNEFFKYAHFYNPFTICEWSVENSLADDLQVTQGIR